MIGQFSTILFDMDGVIVDSEPLHWEAEVKAFEAFGISVPEFEFHNFVGIPAAKNFRYVIDKYGVGNEDLAAMIAYKKQYFRNQRHTLQPIEGAIPFIQSAHQKGKKLGLVTSSEREYQQFVFDKFGISDLFEVFITIEDVVNGKPHPEPYQKAVAKFGVAASSCLVIEDSLAGIKAGKAAGCLVAGLATSFPLSQIEESEADHAFSHYEALNFLLH